MPGDGQRVPVELHRISFQAQFAGKWLIPFAGKKRRHYRSLTVIVSESHPPASSLPPQVSIIIPAFNEIARLPRTLDALSKYATASKVLHELVVVDDGSIDGTAEVVRRFSATTDGATLRVRILINDRNRGKGFSVRRGMLEACGLICLLCDADLSTPIEELDRLRAQLPAAEVVIASRDMPDSVLSPAQPWHRRFLAKSLRTVRRILLLRRLRDTQCGFKLFTRQAARAVFTRCRIDGFAFDIEALAIAAKLGYPIQEVGVIWRDDRDSRVRPIRDGVNMLTAVFAIWWRLTFTRLGGAATVGAPSAFSSYGNPGENGLNEVAGTTKPAGNRSSYRPNAP